MKARPISVIQLIAVVGRHQLDLAALREVDGFVEDEASSVNASFEGQRHAGEDSTTADRIATERAHVEALWDTMRRATE